MRIEALLRHREFLCETLENERESLSLESRQGILEEIYNIEHELFKLGYDPELC